MTEISWRKVEKEAEGTVVDDWKLSGYYLFQICPKSALFYALTLPQECENFADAYSEHRRLSSEVIL